MTYSSMPDIKISNGYVIATGRDNSQHIQVKQCKNKSGAEINLNVRLTECMQMPDLGCFGNSCRCE